MEDKLTKGEQKRVEACEKVTKWAYEDKEHRGCIVLTIDEKSSTCAVIGLKQILVTAFASALKTSPSLRNVLTTTLLLDLATGSSESDTDGDK